MGPLEQVNISRKSRVGRFQKRQLKAEYLAAIKSRVAEKKEEGSVPQLILPKQLPQSLLLGKYLDKSVQNYINAMRKVGGVDNTAIGMAAANGIIAAKNPALLTQHGRHIEIRKGWVKSLLHRMGYVKRKSTNAGKVTVARFLEVQEEFIKAEVLMNEVHPDLIFNGDKTHSSD